MTTQATTYQEQARLTKRRIMRLFTPAIVITFLAIGFVGAGAILLDTWRNFARIQALSLDDVSERFSEEITSVFSDVRLIASAPAAEDYALAAMTDPQSTNEDTLRLRDALVTQIAGLMQAPSTRDYRAIRYIDRSGTVFIEVTHSDSTSGLPVVNTDVAFRERDPDSTPAGDAAVAAGLDTPFGGVTIGELEVETTADGETIPVMRVVSPVTRSTEIGNVLGVIEIELNAQPLLELIRTAPQAGGELQGNSHYVLLDGSGRILADSNLPVDDYLPALAQAEPSYPSADAGLLNYLAAHPTLSQTRVHWTRADLIASREINLGNAPTMPWRLVVVDSLFQALGTTVLLGAVVLVASAVAGLALWYTADHQLTRVLRRVAVANSQIQRLAGQNGTAQAATAMSPAQNTTVPADVDLEQDPDESTYMIRAATQIADQLQTLNQRIEQQTERYNRNLSVAARIGRETAMSENINELLNRSINLISNAFGLYHAQVFLVDDAGINAVLFYSRGEAGQRLLAQEHKLRVGSQSVIGRVTATGEPVIVNDTQSAAALNTHAFNPILKDTRAEMAIPLLIGGDVIGALDLQSDKPNAFDVDDLQTFQLLADQIAIAVYKTRLLRESEQRAQQLETLNRQLTQMAWEELEKEVGLESSYRYNLLEVDVAAREARSSMTTSQMIAMPIRIRGEVIGTIHASPPEYAEFTENDTFILRSVAERISLAVENARLFQETQTNLQETSTLYQTSRFLNEAEEMEDVIEAIILSAMPEATSGQIAIFDDYLVDTLPEWMQIVASWSQGDEGGVLQRDTNLIGTRFRMGRYRLFEDLNATQVTLVEDTEQDTRLGATLREWFRRQGGRSVVFIPLSVRGIWRGSVIIEFPQPRAFTDRDGRIYNNLIDQAGVAIDNRLLLKQTERALAQNERLYGASRIINQAQNLEDLVRATVNTADRPDLNFGLAVFEGALDSTGWPTSLRHVAQSQGTSISSPNQVYFVRIMEHSPLRQREPEVVVVDKQGSETLSLLAALVRSNGDQHGTFFPLFSASQPIALFFVTRASVQALSEENQEIYRALAGSMSTVIENRRLLEQTAAALDETRRLYDANRAITAAQDIETIYRATANYLMQPMDDICRVSFFLARPEPSFNPNFLECVYTATSDSTATEDHPLIRFDANQIPFSKLGELTGHSTEVQDLTDDLQQFPLIANYLAENRTRSVIFNTLEARMDWLGVVVVESDKTDIFTEQYLRFCTAVTDQVAIALENQLLFEQAQQEARQALALAEATQLANQIGGEVLGGIQNLFARVAETAGYDRWLLMALDESNGTLTKLVEHAPEGVPSSVPDILNLSTAHHPISDAIHFNRTLMANHAEDHDVLQNQPELAATLGKHIAAPIMTGGRTIGGLIVGRSAEASDLNERDDLLINTMAAQIAVTMENQRLFRAAERERTTLRSILDTLPAGVLVLDAKTLTPVQYNGQVRDYLGQDVADGVPFTAGAYNLYRTGTNMHYPEDELPINAALSSGESSFSDDVSVFADGDYQADLLINAAPIRNSDGDIINIVAAFEDISNLRRLENTLQDNLRETISLYEATRSLSEADELEEVLEVVLFQLVMNEPENAHIVLRDEEVGGRHVARSMGGTLTIDGLSESVFNPDRITLVNNVQAEGSLTENDRTLLHEQGVEAIACVPLRASHRDTALGWIVVNYSFPYEFTPEDERFLSTLGDNAAVAIDNRYLFQSTQNALRETSSLFSATTTISRARDLNELSRVVRVSVEALSPDVYAAYLMTDPSSPDNLEEMFNLGSTGTGINFREMLMKYGLFRDESIFIDDVLALENPTTFQQALAAHDGIRAFASVSLRVKGMPDGRLFLAYHKPHKFTEGESRYLNAIADSASVVVDNIILLDQIQNALEETSTLYQASRSLADTTTPQEVLDVVVEKLIGVHITQVFIALLNNSAWDTPGATVDVVSNWQSSGGVDLEDISLSQEQFPAWRILATQSVMTIDDVQTETRLDEMERLGIESMDTRSLAIIPLRAPARNIGAIWISSSDLHVHSEREQRVFQAFAEQASLSLEASFLLEQTERRARQLATSTEVSQIVSSILDIEELLPKVVDLIQAQFGYDHVQVFLMDDNREYAQLVASTGDAGRQLLAIKHKLAKGSQSVIGQVTQQSRPIIALDTSDARVIHRPNPYLPLTRSEMALPIFVLGEVIGALDVQSNEPNAFGEDDIAVLTTLAAQISVALDNARLFRQAESRADEMSFLFTITTAAASADGLDEALQNVVELLRGSLGAQSVGIYLLVDDEEEEESAPQTTLQMVARAGGDESAMHAVEIGDAENLIGVVAQDLIPVIIRDIREEPRYRPLMPTSRAAVIAPLSTGGEVTGLITMESERIGAYDQDTLTLLLALGGTLAAIVQNARLLDDISRQKAELETLDKLKSDFLANMSHELRTPLNSIIGFSRVMLKGIDGPLSEMQEQDLTTIYNSGQHLLGLINDVLDQAKIAADKMDLQRDYFDVRGVVEGVRSIGIGLVKEKPVEIYLKAANNLPQAFGDEFRTRQVLLNLVSNAAKFTSEGSIVISVYTVEHDERGAMLRIDVTDSGIGIDEQDIPGLFEAFRQVDSSLTRLSEGTGLGLPIAKSLVELQGGDMYVDSRLGHGSTFSITVPTQPVYVDDTDDERFFDADATPTQKPELAGENGPGGVAGQENGKQAAMIGPPPGVFEQKRQILLIEDAPTMVDQYRRLLQREGFEVLVASIPLEAEPMASAMRPTLIVMDVNFADGKGWDILAKVKDRDDTFDIPVIVVTLSDESERAYRLGAYNFIQRPYTPDDLIKAVIEAEQESNVDRILVIDDQPESTRLIEQILQENGRYRVFSAHTGREGIALVARRRPDLIVLDLRMPEMDGFAVLDDLRSHPETASIPVVVVTGESVLSDDEREKLIDLEIIFKTDLNQDNYQGFISEIRRQIARYHGE